MPQAAWSSELLPPPLGPTSTVIGNLNSTLVPGTKLLNFGKVTSWMNLSNSPALNFLSTAEMKILHRCHFESPLAMARPCAAMNLGGKAFPIINAIASLPCDTIKR